MPRIADRFRGFLPVVVDVETGGFNAQTDALLEVAACLIRRLESVPVCVVAQPASSTSKGSSPVRKIFINVVPSQHRGIIIK